MRVEQFLETSAARRTDHVALVCGPERLTYGAIADAVTRAANGLAALGVRRGDRVVIHLDNSPEAVIALFAVLTVGGVFVLVNPTMKADKLAFVIDDCQAAVLVADRRRTAVVDETIARTALRAVVLVGESEPAATRAAASGPDLVPFAALLAAPAMAIPAARRGISTDLCALVYTSGSTGRPKGVMLSHLNMTSAAASIARYLGLTEDDVILDVLPLSFDYGLYQVLLAFRTGARVVLEKSFTYPAAILELVGREGVTGFPVVPTISAILLRMDLSRYPLDTLRFITNTGAALPARHATELRRLLPQAQIFSMYGLTECKRVAYLEPTEIERRPTSVGKAMPNVEVYLVGQDGARTDEVGELVVRGSNVMLGYWNRPDETAARLRPGPLPGEQVLHTGDLFRMDADGYLYFVGRNDDIIKSRGEKVSPKEVEEILYELPEVVDAAVVGLPDPVLGEAVAAFVTLGPGATLTEAALLGHCARRLESRMVPDRIVLVDALPRTPTGKIDRRALATAAAGPA